MSTKISIIGAGSVGATIAYSLAVTGIATEVVMIDIKKEKAIGEAIDISQGTPFCNPISITAGDYSDAAGSDIVIITSGIARKPGQTRLDLTQTNISIIKQIIPEITKYAPTSKYVIVSNPVDILTYAFTKLSGLPENQIIGSGTILDTARLRTNIAEHFGVSQKNVHACVFGEHGDTSFVPWSLASISDIQIENFQKYVASTGSGKAQLNFDEVENYVRTSGAKIIAGKGATFYAVSISVCHLCKCLLSSVDTVLTVSTMMHGEYGIEDVCLSTLTLVGNQGSKGKIYTPLQDKEVQLLRHSADTLKEIIKSVNI